MAKITGTNGIDIQRDYICVAQYDPSDASVRQVAVQPFASASGAGGNGYWDALTGELKTLRKNIRFAGSAVVCSLPCDMAAVKTLEAESDEPDQQAVLRFELAASLAGRIEEYAYDFYEVDPGRGADRRRYLAAAIRRETLAKVRKAVGGIGLNPYIVDIDMFALTNVFQSNYRERMQESSVLVHGEHQHTKMILVSNSSYIDCGVIDVDMDVCGVQEYTALLREELTRLTVANTDAVRGMPAVFLAGSLFTDRRFTKTVTESVPQSEVLDPFRRITCAAGMDAEQLRTYSPQLAVAVGLALRGEDGE